MSITKALVGLVLILAVILTLNLADVQDMSRSTPGGSHVPVIHAFTAEPAQTQYPGARSTLKWNVTGAATITIEPGVGQVSQTGSCIVTPYENTTYVLTAGSGGGSVSAVVVVSVPSQPPGAGDTTTPGSAFPEDKFPEDKFPE